MFNRWQWALACAVSSLLLLLCGLLVPVYLRAVDVNVIRLAGQDTPSLTAQGLSLVNQQNLGAAWLMFQAAEAEQIPGRENLGRAVTNAMRQHPDWLAWGNDSALKRLFGNPTSSPEPFTSFIVRTQNRQAALNFLSASSSPTVQELLRCRTLTGTTLFAPSQSASGQAFDVAVATCGLLVEQGRLTTGLGENIFKLASAANCGAGSQPLEQMLMDLMSLGRRLTWDQLVAFTSRIEDAATLHILADQVRDANGQLPVLFAAVTLSGKPAAVAKYVVHFSQTAFIDLGYCLRFGAGAMNELLARDQLLYRASSRWHLGVDCSLHLPWLAFMLKWLGYLAGGFLLAASLHFARPAMSSLEQPLQVRGFHVARESLFALGFLLVVLLLSEPFLAQDTRKAEVAFRLHVPATGPLVLAGIARNQSYLMNNMILLTLLLFFVLQGLIYISCLVKLAEIRRQNVPPRMKLRLLENEDHLFDAGLYLGFVGTIVSLILVSMGVIKFSLMAAYSSTSFGIVFVCVFKIFNLRPARRRLILEAEAEAGGPPVPVAVPKPVTAA